MTAHIDRQHTDLEAMTEQAFRSIDGGSKGRLLRDLLE